MPFSVAEVEVILVADPVSAVGMKGLYSEEDDEKGLYEEDDEEEVEEELLEDAPSVLEGDDDGLELDFDLELEDVPCCFSFLNLALTVIDLLIFTVQVPAPLQLPPLQPEKE